MPKSQNMRHHDKAHMGNSLITVLLAMGLASILSLVIASMMSDFSKQSHRLEHKIQALQLERVLMNSFMSQAVCLNNVGSGPVDLSTVPSAPAPNTTNYITTRISLNDIKDGPASTSPVILTSGSGVPNVFGLKVVNIGLKNWYTPSADNYRADLELALESDSGPIAPVSVRDIRIFTTGPLASKTILACGSPGQGLPTLGPTITANSWSIAINAARSSNQTATFTIPPKAVFAAISANCTISTANGGATLIVELLDATNTTQASFTVCSFSGDSDIQTGGVGGSASFPIPVGIVTLRFRGQLSTDGIFTGGGATNSAGYTGQLFVDPLL